MQLNGGKIRRQIFFEGMTQEAFADRVELSRATVNAIINGKSCSASTAKKIADALRVDVSELTNE